MKNRKRIIKIGAAVIAVALLFGGLALLSKDRVAEKIQDVKMQKYSPNPSVRKLLDNAIDDTTDPSIPDDIQEEIVQKQEEFQAEYSNGIGWLYIPDTNIDYPIMFSGDNSYYLHKAPDGSYLYAGSLFLDYHCNTDFTTFNSIIYGHNMQDGTKFAQLVDYQNVDFFREHKYGWLTTESEVLPIEFFAVAQVKHNNEVYFTSPNVEDWLATLRDESMIFDEVELCDEDNVITLSTCAGSNSEWRIIVVGKILK